MCRGGGQGCRRPCLPKGVGYTHRRRCLGWPSIRGWEGYGDRGDSVEETEEAGLKTGKRARATQGHANQRKKCLKE